MSAYPPIPVHSMRRFPNSFGSTSFGTGTARRSAHVANRFGTSSHLRFAGSAQETVETRDFGGFWHFAIYDAAAVGMWKAAFCAAFQARRAGTRMWLHVSLPALRAPFPANCSNFLLISRFWLFWSSEACWEPECGRLGNPRRMTIFFRFSFRAILPSF